LWDIFTDIAFVLVGQDCIHSKAFSIAIAAFLGLLKLSTLRLARGSPFVQGCKRTE